MTETVRKEKIEELRRAVRLINDDIAILQERKEEALSEIGELRSGLKKGDVVMWKDRSQRKNLILAEKFKAALWSDSHFEIIGRGVKRDGSFGDERTMHFYHVPSSRKVGELVDGEVVFEEGWDQ